MINPRTAVPALALAILTAPGSAHDEDWRKLADATPPVEGPIWRLGDPGVRGPEFPASGITCMSVLPLNTFGLGSTKGNDCWGYVSKTGREYAIFGQEKGFGVVEVTDPANPIILASIPGPTSLWHDVKVVGDYAYGVSQGGAGTQVIDLSRADEGIATLVHNWTDNTAWNAAHNIICNEDNGHLYVCGANFGNGGLAWLDLADPLRPSPQAAWADMYVHDACVVTMDSGAFAGREIAFCASGLGGGWNDTGLRIVDFTDKLNPVVIATEFWSGAGYSHQVWLSEDRQYLFLGDEYDEIERGHSTRTRVFDISDLTNPFLAATFTNGLGVIDHNQYVVGDYLFQANYTSGLRIFDVSNPLNASEVAWIDTFPTSDIRAFNGAWSNYPFFPSGNVLISDMARGLVVVRPDADLQDRLRLVLPDAPATVSPDGGDVLLLTIDEMNVTLDPSSVELVYDGGLGDTVVAGEPGKEAGVWEFAVPAGVCGGTASYHFRAATALGEAYTLPADSPAQAITAAVGEDCPPACFADIDGNGDLNIDDVDAFVAGFVAADLGVADCDGSGGLNIDDVDCFVASFVGGCL
ncbi:MAG: hypothetical protein DHS20C14_15200 [Phycisphaeraceae bacterium]|nr:MAG: hypothetical protein DHS20C14_15200 [Phycisphaeraceae bacterium]